MNSIWIIGALSTLFMLSCLANLFFVWYSWRMLQRLNFYEIELHEILGAIKNFTNHLSTVYEMEMFYGDETLQYLLRHAKDLTEAFDQHELDTLQSPVEEIIDDESAAS